MQEIIRWTGLVIGATGAGFLVAYALPRNKYGSIIAAAAGVSWAIIWGRIYL